jgi:hypothetical protein
LPCLLDVDIRCKVVFFDFEEGYCLICGSNSCRGLVEKAGCFELGRVES